MGELKDPDYRVEDHGTVFLFRPKNEVSRVWLAEHTDGQWHGDALAVEHRYAGDLARRLRADGFAVGA